MPKYDFIFVDESGDPGFKLDEASGRLLSSSYYIAAALHLTDDAFRYLNQHVAAFRYYSGFNRELKIPPQKVEFSRLLELIQFLSEGGANIWASVVYVDKLNYTGRLPEGGRETPRESRLVPQLHAASNAGASLSNLPSAVKGLRPGP